ncbi:uncharacterized protein DNG_09505 [Cephalotrichum gorgonifer]|uniref:Uncharacterized protein n=1 Tax=Cephalotrichum gorgonifer TaxID=2041049 RepID=A0AAE8SZD0_9PEZI|nr:uncharacterized protein DNG_09505 [Cephalotrichum gorgonifer]
MAHETDTPSTSLCARCSAFQFQDLALSDFTGQAEADGHRSLKLDKRHKQHQFLLPQKIRDTLPGLPGLRGCEMCDLFRRSISCARLDHQGPIECELRFIWVDILETKGDGNVRVDGGYDNSFEGLRKREEGDDEVINEGDECDEDGGKGVYAFYGVGREDGTDDCSSCITATNRNVWGLVVHPADTPDTYFRVGIFTSRAGDAGGTGLFTKLAYQEITLI